MFRTGFVGRQFPSGLGAGSVSGGMTSLDLNFMSGALDSRITFTRGGTATYFDSTGTMQTASANTPRFDYDPVSLQLRGLLLEEVRTNSVRNGNATGATIGTPGVMPSNWSIFSNGGLSSQIVATPTINGLTCVDIRYFGTSTGTFLVQAFDTASQIVASNPQVWTSSAYIAMVGGSTANITSFSLQTRYAGDGNFDQIFTPTANLVRIVNVGSTAGVGTTFIVPALSIVFGTGVAIDVTIRFGGVQCELGAFATSYIPTTAAAATRAAETATMPIGSWYNPAAGTFDVEYILPQIPASGTQGGVLRVDDGTSNNDGLIFVSAASQTFVFGVSGGVTQLNNNTGAPVLNAISKSAFTYGGLWTGQTNAGPVSIGTGSTPMVSPTRVALGTSHASLTQWQLDGWMRRVKYWPRALAGGEMQTENMVPSLDIDLRAPTLDPRIAFTRASNGSFFNSAGVLTTVGSNVPRLDYDKDTLQPRGLLVEEARTNSIRNSVAAGLNPPNQGPTNWGFGSAAGCAVSFSNPGLINGIQFVDVRYQGTTTTTFIVIVFENSVQITAAPGDVWTESLYVQTLGGLAGITNVGVNTRFTGGSAPNTTNILPISALTRISQTSTAPAGTTAIQPALLIGVQQGVPIDFTIRVGAPQCELGAFATSYIPTSGAAATRAAESAYIACGPWATTGPASIATEYDFTNTAGFVPGGLSDGTFGNSVYFQLNTMVEAGVSTANAPAGSWDTSPGQNKMAGGWGSNVLNVSINGSAIGTTTGLVGPTYPWTLRASFGSSPWGVGNQINGHSKRFRYWPRLLSNAELQAVSR